MSNNALNRRDFLKTGLVGGISLVFSFYLGAPARSFGEPTSSALTPNGWLKIDPTGRVTVFVEKSEIGQGVLTSLALIVAEELEADWSLVQVEHVPITDAYAGMSTGGSNSVIHSWMPLRRAGAQARQTLIAAAAKIWSARVESCRAEKGYVIHTPSGRRLSYGELVDTARQMPEINREAVTLKDPKDFH
jgi:isoquinoline 1-oxidoreductase beta subunit